MISESSTRNLIEAGANMIFDDATARGIGRPSGIGDYASIAQLSLPGQEWDLKGKAFTTDNLYVLNGVAQRHDLPGNVAWGNAMGDIGVPLNVAVAGSQLQGALDRVKSFNSSGDDGLDTSAVIQGYNMNSLNAASGGYVLYPSKPNNNAARAVYSK